MKKITCFIRICCAKKILYRHWASKRDLLLTVFSIFTSMRMEMKYFTLDDVQNTQTCDWICKYRVLPVDIEVYRTKKCWKMWGVNHFSVRNCSLFKGDFWHRRTRFLIPLKGFPEISKEWFTPRENARTVHLPLFNNCIRRKGLRNH